MSHLLSISEGPGGVNHDHPTGAHDKSAVFPDVAPVIFPYASIGSIIQRNEIHENFPGKTIKRFSTLFHFLLFSKYSKHSKRPIVMCQQEGYLFGPTTVFFS
jgi:hypothetical protein